MIVSELDECVVSIPSAEDSFEERQLHQHISDFLRKQKKEESFLFADIGMQILSRTLRNGWVIQKER